MTKPVTITMQQMQDSAEEPEVLRFVTDGTWSYENNIGLLKYSESDITGMRGTLTSLSILPDRIIVDRKGAVISRMEFKKGVKNTFLYNTPYGTADMGLDTKSVTHHFDEAGGRAEIDYILGMQHRVFSKNKFIISVEQQGEKTNV